MDHNYVNTLREAYGKANARLIFLDYDGTLIPFANLPEHAVMNGKAEKIITSLTNDHKNKVVIISGRGREFLECQFKKPNITLIAEHGFFIKEFKKGWIANAAMELTWKQEAISILKYFTDKCNGAFMEEKFASLAWHYRNVEPDLAKENLAELKKALHEFLRNNAGLQILEGKKVLEIKGTLYNKGTVASRLLKKSHFDFVMAVGDDKTDEDLFKALPHHAFTIKIGINQSAARFKLRKQEQLYDLFLELFPA